ncbi:MAG: NFACT RNA binding domain-containing protein [candidate division WOR-3 bacterium]|nr:NFACT RNA binding domain-containing protein [candidate division WOR-3 bacterium]
MNGIYLFLALREIAPEIVNKFIQRISAQNRLLQIEFDELSLFISLYPEVLGLYVDKRIRNFERLNFFDDNLAGMKITGIEQIGFTPVVEFYLEKITFGQKICSKTRLSFYRAGPNFSLFHDKGRRDLFSRFVEKNPKLPIWDLTPEHLGNKESLIKNFEGIDKSLAEELTEKNLSELKEIINGKNYKLKLVSFSPLKISLFSQSFIKEYDSWNALLKDCVNFYLEKRNKEISEKVKKKRIEKLEKILDKLKARVSDADIIELYRITGELILTNFRQITKGMDRIKLFNPYTQQEMEVKLDPKKTPQQNAEYYFKEYKRLKKGIPKIQERIKKLEEEIEALKSGKTLVKKIPEITVEKQKEKKSLPFRQFTLNSGSLVFVGKDAQSNMELTFKFAKPDDYFFHVRGYEGAHTILRPVLQKGQGVRKEDIEKAAAIAAFFSKAKNQKNVAVSYTQRKFLKKNKKGKLGMVILMREEVIFVDPGLPPDAQK